MNPESDDAKILQAFQTGIFHINDDWRICKGERIIAERLNTRNRSERSDPRVTLCFDGKKYHRSVSRLVWTVKTGMVIPDGFEIHHMNEDPQDNRFENLICVHSFDHAKIHRTWLEDVPF